MNMKSPGWRLLGLLAGAVLTSTVSAGPIQVLLDEDFQSVTGLIGPGTNANTIRTVENIVTNNPGQLDGSPTTAFSNNPGTGTGTGGNASNSSFNVRRWDNPIDGSASAAPATFGDDNFDNFFGGSPNQFLVIGDNSGNLGGAPNGGSRVGASSTMSIRFALDSISLSDPRKLSVVFDYVFDANNVSNPDDFVAELILADTSTFNLLNHTAPSVDTRGTFSSFIPYASLAAAPVSLNFRLVEGTGNGSSAVGLDNLRVTAIPEPASLALLGVGLIGLGLLRRRKV